MEEDCPMEEIFPMTGNYRWLYHEACSAREHAYAPYSGFKVGAALLCSDGEIYYGCNIENAAFTPTVCAERVALFRAVADGRRDFTAIAVAGGKETDSEEQLAPCYPCGVCRQVMSEFCGGDFVIVTAEGGATLSELLPKSFGLEK